MSSSRDQLTGHLQEYQIEEASQIGAKVRELRQLGRFLSMLQKTMAGLAKTKEQTSGHDLIFKGTIARLSKTLAGMDAYTSFLRESDVLQEQIREWVSIECARIFFELRLFKSEQALI